MARDAGAEEMLALLRARPDAALPPQPRNPGELASRLGTTHSVQHALALVGLPALQVVEALLALDGRAPRSALARLLGAEDGPAAARLDRALAELTSLALVWPVAGELRIAGAWRELMPGPLALGRSGAELYALLTVAQLATMGAALGLDGYGRKSEWVEALTAAGSDPVAVERRLAAAAPALADAVRRIAWNGPRVSGVHLPAPYERVAPGEVGVQLALQGWVVPTDWGRVGEMPREVALAVRGPGYRAPFDPEPPLAAAAAVDPHRLGAAGRHAAGAAIDAVRRLLALMERTPLATLQAGGVGVRELRRAAKLLSGDEPAVRLWLEVAAAAGLVAGAEDAVLVSTAAEEWLAAEPAAALAALLTAWWGLPVTPSHRMDDDTGKPAPALGWMVAGPDGVRLRADLLGTLAAMAPDGPGRGLADPDPTALAERLAHLRPVAYGSAEALVPALRAALLEAQLLGLVADAALTPLGFDLLAALAAPDPQDALGAALAGLLPSPAATATFLPDLTVVVAGAVGAGLSRLLDEVATAESRDTASTWRFSPASVRRALDGGRSADELLAVLAEVADNPLPQPLEYLVRDVARRHGELQVVPAACAVVVADPALAAEVAAHRTLAPLGLRRLAATVLASAKPAADTLTALRAAGYAPVRQDATGQPVLERAAVRRAAPTRRPAAARRSAPSVDLPALARQIAGARCEQRAPEPANLLAEEVPLLSPAEAAVLGNGSTRVVEPRMKLLGTLVAWCREKRAERNFALERITAVSPVES